MTREAVQQAREWLIARRPEPPKRPTIAELDAILSSEDRTPVEINPDGTIGVHVLERDAESHAAYRREGVVAELESLAKEMCDEAELYRRDSKQCDEAGNSLGSFGDRSSAIALDRQASAIRRRLEQLKEEG